MVLCFLCRLTGYIVAIPCTEAGLTSAAVAQFMVERVFVHFGLPSAIYSDHDHLINAEFCKEIFRLSGVDEYKSIVYKPKSNGRAKNSVQLVVQSLRKLLERKGSKDCVVLLPLATCGLNDLPGPLRGASPYKLVLGRHRIGFGDTRPILPHTDCKDAAEFFTQLAADREVVRDKFTAIQKKATEDFRRRYPLQVFQPGETVWAKVNRAGMDRRSTKLSRLWKGRFEVLQRVGSGRYKIHTEKGEKYFHAMDLKLCLEPLDRGSNPVHWYSIQFRPCAAHLENILNMFHIACCLKQRQVNSLKRKHNHTKMSRCVHAITPTITEL